MSDYLAGMLIGLVVGVAVAGMLFRMAHLRMLIRTIHREREFMDGQRRWLDDFQQATNTRYVRLRKQLGLPAEMKE